MIDSAYFFIAEPESAVQISVRACVRELFAVFFAIFREMSFSEESYQCFFMRYFYINRVAFSNDFTKEKMRKS